MSTATKPNDIAKHASAKPEPPHIQATYKGTFYRKTGKGYEYIEFEKTVKWPLSAVLKEGWTPIGLFRKYKERKLMAKVNGVLLRECRLVKVEGDLPRIKNTPHLLDWMCNYTELVEFAKEIGEVKYVQIDLKSEERSNKSTELRSHLYQDVQSLRNAIKLILSEPEAFDRLQERLAKKDAAIPKEMEAEIAALADDE